MRPRAGRRTVPGEVRREPGMYPTNEVRLAAIMERHQERARHRRAVSAAVPEGPARIGAWITQPSRWMRDRKNPVAKYS